MSRLTDLIAQAKAKDPQLELTWTGSLRFCRHGCRSA